MVGALNDSGFLIYLQPISKDNPGATVMITIKQGENEVLASVESEASSPQRAESLAKAFNNLLFFRRGFAGRKRRRSDNEEHKRHAGRQESSSQLFNAAAERC